MRHCPECFGMDNWHEPKCKLAREMLKRKSLTAVPVLAEPESLRNVQVHRHNDAPKPQPRKPNGEARESNPQEDTEKQVADTQDSRGGSQSL